MKRQITFILPEYDIAEAQKAHIQRQKLDFRTVLYFFLAWISISFSIYGAAVLIHRQGWWHINLFYIILFCLIYLGAVFVIPIISHFIILPKRIKSAVKKNRYAGLEQTMIRDDKALAFHSKRIKGSYPWQMNFQIFWHFISHRKNSTSFPKMHLMHNSWKTCA